jgi:hypothetical protein
MVNCGMAQPGQDGGLGVGDVERLYQQRPYMVEGEWCIGTKPQSFGEGVHVRAHTADYETAYNYWNGHPEEDLALYRWRNGVLVRVGRPVMRNGVKYFVPIPPAHVA